jgi:hypothetical protein
MEQHLYFMLVEVEERAIQQQCLLDLVVKVVEETGGAQNEDNFPARPGTANRGGGGGGSDRGPGPTGAGGGGGKGIVIVSY